MEETKKAPPPSNNTSNTKKKREDKQRRRDHRAVENIMKELINMDDTEKLRILFKKYSDLYDEFRALQNNAALSDKRLTILQREKDQLQAEQGKLVLAKARMESLCRELQKQNKLIKEENLAKIREEEERRKEVALKFQNTLSEVSSMVQENSEKNIKLRDDNKDMANKIQALCEQFDKRKEQLVRVEKQLELERQLSEATIAKAELELKAGQEMWNKEREILQSNLKKSEENCQKLQENIKGLEENLQMYSGKYKEFESTITRSNEVFDNCKSEMYKMTKQIATLEKECKMFKQRWQKNAQCVIELTATKQAQDNKIDSLERKLEQLQKLCRQLQTDRSSYIKLLKANGIEPISQKCVEEPVTSPRKTKKEIELEHLKNNLKVLQEHFNSMQAKSSVGLSINDDEIKETGSYDHELSLEKIPENSSSDVDATILPETEMSGSEASYIEQDTGVTNVSEIGDTPIDITPHSDSITINFAGGDLGAVEQLHTSLTTEENDLMVSTETLTEEDISENTVDNMAETETIAQHTSLTTKENDSIMPREALTVKDISENTVDKTETETETIVQTLNEIEQMCLEDKEPVAKNLPSSEIKNNVEDKLPSEMNTDAT